MADLKAKLKSLPREPGVYFFKNARGQIIYIGKAAVLKNRVRSYFQQTAKDPKTTLLMAVIADLDWITVDSEVEALFLESEFIKRYRPRFNIELRDDKHWIYVKITARETWPVVSYVRRPLDDKAVYFGPFTSSDAVRRAMKLLRRVFPYVTHEVLPRRACLQAHLGLCPNPEEGAISPSEYKRQIRQLILYLTGQKVKLLKQIDKDMNRASKQRDYEAAAHYRDQLRDLQALGKQMLFGDKESFDLAKDQALSGLAERLGILIPRRIEAYDISHLQGSDNVASMIVFTDGVPNKDEYRRFRMQLKGNDDFAHMREVIRRRFSRVSEKGWPKPDLMLIDGGKGQLAAALEAMAEKGVNIPAIGLAKRDEEIIVPTVIARNEGTTQSLDPTRDSSRSPRGVYPEPSRRARDDGFKTILLPKSSHVLQLLQRVRDEAHRFAVTYHSLLRAKRQVKSQLDDIPGVGPATRKKLIKAFGSTRALKVASESEIASVVGYGKARVIKEHLGKVKAPFDRRA